MLAWAQGRVSDHSVNPTFPPPREERIIMEIIVDANGGEKQAMGMSTL